MVRHRAVQVEARSGSQPNRCQGSMKSDSSLCRSPESNAAGVGSPGECKPKSWARLNWPNSSTLGRSYARRSTGQGSLAAFLGRRGRVKDALDICEPLWANTRDLEVVAAVVHRHSHSVLTAPSTTTRRSSNGLAAGWNGHWSKHKSSGQRLHCCWLAWATSASGRTLSGGRNPVSACHRTGRSRRSFLQQSGLADGPQGRQAERRS